MYPQVKRISTTRTWLLEILKDLSARQLNEIPAGFNNNIIWNAAHMISAQQGVCYVRAGLNAVDEKYYTLYKPGTKPDETVDDAEIAHIKNLLFSTLETLEADLEKNIFVNYVPWMTRYGQQINNIEDALDFLPFHEGLHMGYIMALKKVYQNNCLKFR